MNIKFTRKKLAALILLVIIVPIIYNKTSALIGGLIQMQMMKMPKEVVVGHPDNVNTNISAESMGRVCQHPAYHRQ